MRRSVSTFSGREWTPGVKDAGFFRATGCDTDQWERLVHRGPPPAPVHVKNSYATETPVTDGDRLLIRSSARIYCIQGPRAGEGPEKEDYRGKP